QPAAAAAAVDRLARDDRRRPVLAARLAWREGRLTAALQGLDSAPARPARRLRATLTAEQTLLASPPPGQSMIVNSFGHIAPVSVHDHETSQGGAARAGYVPGRVLHLVTDALPTTSAGYTIRTHEIALAQREAGLDPHVATRAGYPVTQGRIDGRRLVELDGVPYHRLLPRPMPGQADTPARRRAARAWDNARAGAHPRPAERGACRRPATTAPARRAARGEQLRQRQARPRP